MDVSQGEGLFAATIIGAAIGVVAGTVIQYFLTLLLEKRTRARQTNSLLKELVYNRSLIDELAAELQKLRNAANGGVFDKYFGWFSYSKGIFAQANASASNGDLYELLSIEEIRHAQRIISALNNGHENWVNGEITRRRNVLLNTPDQFDKRELVAFVDFIDNQIRELATWTDSLIKKLGKA